MLCIFKQRIFHFTVTQIWNCSNRCILRLFDTDTNILFAYPQSLRNLKIHQPNLEKLQIKGSKNWMKHFSSKTGKNASILIIKFGLMDFRFLKCYGSGWLLGTFQSLEGFTVHANKISISQKVPKYTCLSSYIFEWL